MRTIALISASAFAVAIGLASPVAAQELSIGGTVVPMDQIEGVQAKCDELFAENSAVALAKPDAKAPAAEAPAAGASDSVAATESAAETPIDATAEVAANAAPVGGNMAAGADATVGAGTPIDLASLTVALCEEGGFTASAD
jgi:hypothetical protein